MSQGMERPIVIRGLGHYLPQHVVTSEELMPTLEGKANAVDQAVLGKIEVETRRWSNDEETVAFMGRRALEMALEHAGMEAASIDLLILTNWTDRIYVPDLAPRIATAMGMKDVLAFDLCSACTGFVLGSMTAASYLNSGMCKRAAVVSSEQFSKGVRPGSKGTLVVGDAAGAIILERGEPGEQGIMATYLRSEGDLWDLVASRLPQPWISSKAELADYAVNRMVHAASTVLERGGVGKEAVDWVIIHPGSDVVTRGVRNGIGIPDERYAENFSRCGNTSSASIPIALSEYFHKGVIKKGQLVLGAAVGSGFYHGAMLFRV